MNNRPNLDDLYETAMEEGAAIVELWHIAGSGPAYVCVTDEGFWTFRDNAEHTITERDAARLLDLYFYGYTD